MSNGRGRRQAPIPGLVFDKQPLYEDAFHIGQTSPPDTPAIPRTQNHHRSVHVLRPPVPDPNIRPVGRGHQFSYQPSELLSPGPSPSTSSSSSVASDAVDDESSTENYRVEDAVRARVNGKANPSSGNTSDSDSCASSGSSVGVSENSGSRNLGRGSERESDEVQPGFIRETTTFTGDFVIEDVDPMDSDYDDLEVLQPTEIESNRSRSRSRHQELPRRMMRDMRNLTCDTDTSEEEGEEITEETFYKWQKYLRHRRVSLSSSLGKRTFSERSSDSGDSDGGDLEVNDVGSSARRMRKRMHRGSLLFQDPPEPRIDELEEPNSSEDEILAGQSLAQELPYWTLEIMEMEDSG